MLAMGRSCRDSPAYWVPRSLFCLSNMWRNHHKLREIVEIYFFWFWVKLSTSSFIIIPQTFPGNPRDPPIFADLELRGGSEITDGSLFIVQLTSERPPPSPALRSVQSHQILYQSEQIPESAFCEFYSPFKSRPPQIRSDLSSWKSGRLELLVPLVLTRVALGAAWKVFTQSGHIGRLQKEKTLISAENSGVLILNQTYRWFTF